jgi:hypothetical protein
MNSLSFKKWLEVSDIFGFERDKRAEHPDDFLLTRPIERFDVEEMMELLARKSLGTMKAEITFPNVIQWGNQPGCVKLEVDPGYRFYVKKLGIDKEGNHRWVTKKMFQLNRNGFGGYEDSVAQEVFEQLESAAKSMIEAPPEDYKDLSNLAERIYTKMKRSAKEIFFPEGIKKLHDDCYVIKFGVRGQGLEARNQQRVEQNQTMITYDRHQGTIRVINYNLLSNTGGPHEFRIPPSDFECYFFPSQDRDEISEVVATRMRYY